MLLITHPAPSSRCREAGRQAAVFNCGKWAPHRFLPALGRFFYACSCLVLACLLTGHIMLRHYSSRSRQHLYLELIVRYYISRGWYFLLAYKCRTVQQVARTYSFRTPSPIATNKPVITLSGPNSQQASATSILRMTTHERS